MATKKDTPNLIFRKEWWDSLRHKSPDLFKDALSILFSTYFDGKPFDPYAFDEQGSNPTPSQDLAIPMVKAAIEAKETYIAKCERNAANIRKRYENAQSNTTVNDRTQSNTTVNDRTQSNTTVNDRIRTQGNIIQSNVMESNIIQSNSFFSACEAEQAEKEKKETLLLFSMYLLEKAVLKPYSEAEKAWNFNASQDWSYTNANGCKKDFSRKKLEYLKGWKCQGDNYSLEDAAFFVEVIRCTNLYVKEFIDNFHGLMYQKGLYFLFDSKKVADAFTEYFAQEVVQQQKVNGLIERRYPNSKGFAGRVYKKDY